MYVEVKTNFRLGFELPWRGQGCTKHVLVTLEKVLRVDIRGTLLVNQAGIRLVRITSLITGFEEIRVRIHK